MRQPTRTCSSYMLTVGIRCLSDASANRVPCPECTASLSRPGVEATERVRLPTIERPRESVGVEVERPQEERSRWCQELHVHLGVLEAGQLGISFDLVDHAELEGALDGGTQGRRRRAALL